MKKKEKQNLSYINIVRKNNNQCIEKLRFIVKTTLIKEDENDDESKILREHVGIALQNKDTSIYVLHRYTEFIETYWGTTSAGSRENRAADIVQLLNYCLINNINLKEATVDNFADFMNLWSTNKTKSTSKRMFSTISYFIHFIAKKEISSSITESMVEIRHPKGYNCPRFTLKTTFSGVIRDGETNYDIGFELAILLLEYSLIVVPDISFGLYLSIFGGLRVSEITNLIKTSFKKNPVKAKNIIVHIRNRYLVKGDRPKKSRNQVVFSVDGLFYYFEEQHKRVLKSKKCKNHEALFINNWGNPMTSQNYRNRFTKLIDYFLNDLSKNGNYESSILSLHLSTITFNPHLGRGIYSNLIAELYNNPTQMAAMRGDSSLESILTYISGSKRIKDMIQLVVDKVQRDGLDSLIKYYGGYNGKENNYY